MKSLCSSSRLSLLSSSSWCLFVFRIAGFLAQRLQRGNSATEDLELRGHLGSVHCIAFGPKRDVIASGGADNSIRLWDAESGELKDVLRGHPAQ